PFSVYTFLGHFRRWTLERPLLSLTAFRVLSSASHGPAFDSFRHDRDNWRFAQKSSQVRYFAAGAGLAWFWWYFLSNGKSEPFPTFPLTVHCAENVRPQPSKDRLSAIHALDVVADVAQEAQPAVVSITSRDKGFLSRHVQSTGSGFIIDDTGHVITNAHVVGYRSDVFVHLSDGRSYPGRVLAVDVSSDLALVQLDVKPDTARSLPQLPLAKDLKSVRPGHFVLALGSPLMLANSVTVGVVSALDRDLGHSEGLKYIQTDAIITVGNSGGPLVNLYGEVIGVNSMIAGIGVGFAIPVDQVRKFSELALRAAQRVGNQSHSPSEVAGDSYILTESGSPPHGAPQRRYLGLVMRTLTPELAFELASRGGPQFLEITEGVLIHAILRNSPAQR
ncbi:Serine protease HTRA2 mitochondrial, partial [Fasciolopsis buskii]